MICSRSISNELSNLQLKLKLKEIEI